MEPRTHELLLTLAKTLVWAALVVLVLTFLGVVQVLAADSLPVFEDFQEQSRGAVAIAALGGGITAAGILAGLGGILRRMLEGPPPADG